MNFFDTVKDIGGIFTTIKDIIRNFVRDPNESDKLATQLMIVFSDVVKAELASSYWLAGNWRALVMLLITAGLTVKSIMGTAFDVSSDYVLFTLLVIGLLGYKLDGKILEFVVLMFRFGKSEEKKLEQKRGNQNDAA